MKIYGFERRRSALGSLGLLAICALAAGGGGCQLQLADDKASGKSGDGPTRMTSAGAGDADGNGGARSAESGASNGNGGTPSNDQGGAASAAAGAGSAAAGAGNSTTAGPRTHKEDCGNPDSIPNDDREHAVDFGTGATLCVTNSQDSDWFYVDTPKDDRAHVIQLDISETDGSWIEISITADKDGSDMGRIQLSQRGLKQSSFITVGPGTRTFFQVYGRSSNTDTTTIDVSVSAEADEHEPNNDRASATPIEPASEISAQLILPYVSQTDQQTQDWYEIQLAAGTHTLQMTAVPTDLYPTIQVSSVTEVIIADNKRGANKGAEFSFTFTVKEAGSYYVMIYNWAASRVVSSGTKAASYAEPYTFQID
ncbi:MAG TPA: hypothetical protein VJV79_24050 [Polyangiaceae bacterium]|nr:hypothetical protein [Polyangiaceae bacterium]